MQSEIAGVPRNAKKCQERLVCKPDDNNFKKIPRAYRTAPKFLTYEVWVAKRETRHKLWR